MNLKKELSICNANRWQRESKTTRFLFTSSSSHRKSFHLVRLEHHEEGKQVHDRKKRHGKNTQQPKKLVPVTRSKEIIAQGTKRIFGYDLRDVFSDLREVMPQDSN